MNAMQKAVVSAGLADAPKEKKLKPRAFTCHKCGEKMYSIPGTNVMTCSKCNNYFIFDAKSKKEQSKVA